MHACPLVNGVVPHVGGPVLPPGCATVLIAGQPAARVGDMPPGIFARGLRAMGAVNHGQTFPAPVEATGAGLI